jgi:iron complex transport system substrate-binding protein
MQTQMTELAGGIPVWQDHAQGGWTVVNLEQVAAWNPDTIFVISYFDPVVKVVGQLKADPQWEALDAVEAGAIYGFPGDFYSWDQPDTRWILGLTWMATRLHPERFAEIDLQEEIFAFYETLYELDAETVESEVLPLVYGDVMVP